MFIECIYKRDSTIVAWVILSVLNIVTRATVWRFEIVESLCWITIVRLAILSMPLWAYS